MDDEILDQRFRQRDLKIRAVQELDGSGFELFGVRNSTSLLYDSLGTPWIAYYNRLVVSLTICDGSHWPVQTIADHHNSGPWAVEALSNWSLTVTLISPSSRSLESVILPLLLSTPGHRTVSLRAKTQTGSRDLVVPEAGDPVIVNHPNSLHESVADRWANEPET